MGLAGLCQYGFLETHNGLSRVTVVLNPLLGAVVGNDVNYPHSVNLMALLVLAK